VAEWRALDQVGDVPVENTGGAGTENVHWRETVFNREIMTGFIESGVDQPLSRITIAAMEDLGYEVDRSAADDYSLLQALRAGEETRVVLGYDVLLQGPILVLDPDGSRSVLQR
ncbi:MAG: leishmanolysin-related zinc metalloendopeptidase, partial [Gemmatimonadota bacterium]